jgi:hypothetical protein
MGRVLYLTIHIPGVKKLLTVWENDASFTKTQSISVVGKKTGGMVIAQNPMPTVGLAHCVAVRPGTTTTSGQYWKRFCSLLN